jgi:ABC-type polysaccharide/polyol phosphate transport system ATPase subunit
VPARNAAIEVEGLHKAFRIPSNRVDTLKERMLHPFSSRDYTSLVALRDVTFSVGQGEFLGVVGRNGSGKTTLLKLIASIYKPDRGQIRVAGTLAPFIELGVGFNLNLTARDNVLLNGVMMGLTPREARRRFDEVIEFAELEDFVELRLKNYSSGMAMRLAFSVMVQAEADVMLIDEVLAVGDASFAQKCKDTFQRLREEGRSCLFVSHDMDSMSELCNRAILIEDGALEAIGDSHAVARRYFQINFAKAGSIGTPSEGGGGLSLELGRIAEVWLEDGAGRHPGGFERGTPLTVVVAIEAQQPIEKPILSFDISSTDGARVFATPETPLGDRLEAGERLVFRARVDNALTPGGYIINCIFSHEGNLFNVVDLRRRAAELTVWGADQLGYVALDWDYEIEREGAVKRIESAE